MIFTKSYRRLLLTTFLISMLILKSGKLFSQADSLAPALVATAQEPKKQEKKWYETISLRGYSQFRLNTFKSNPKLVCDQCDKTYGGPNQFFVRRARLIFSGNVHERVFIYIQPDFASAPTSDNLNFAQLRDLYADIALDKKKEYRLRPGLSKIPYGFENLQSSQNRLPLDRADPTNSALPNERDLGLMFYYAPAHIRDRLKELQNGKMKGSGDYGVFGIGIYNGQTLNKPDLNNDFHAAARLSYPFKFKNGQMIEPGIQAYRGLFNVNSRSKGVGGPQEFKDQRVAGSFVLYPQPFGIQSEYNWGTGPQFDPASKSIVQRHLEGGYAQFSYRINAGNQIIFPFTRFQYFNGGKKQELDARKYIVREQEIGIEWQPFANLEVVAMYTFSDRTYGDFEKPDNRQSGRLLRIQVQVNY